MRCYRARSAEKVQIVRVLVLDFIYAICHYPKSGTWALVAYNVCVVPVLSILLWSHKEEFCALELNF